MGHRAYVEALLQRTADDHQQRGSCCCSAHQRARTTSFALSIPQLPSYSPSMTPAFGSASVPFLDNSLAVPLGSRQPPSVHGGLRSALRTGHAANWASWADCLPVIKERHCGVVRTDPPEDAVHLRGVVESRLVLTGVGYDTPDWQALADGLRPSPIGPWAA